MLISSTHVESENPRRFTLPLAHGVVGKETEPSPVVIIHTLILAEYVEFSVEGSAQLLSVYNLSGTVNWDRADGRERKMNRDRKAMSLYEIKSKVGNIMRNSVRNTTIDFGG
jgi:hypothetical protein